VFIHSLPDDYFFPDELRRDEPFFFLLELDRPFDDLEPLFFFAAPLRPPPVVLLTVAQARRAASSPSTPCRL
jgi:hypothetical protein